MMIYQPGAEVAPLGKLFLMQFKMAASEYAKIQFSPISQLKIDPGT